MILPVLQRAFGILQNNSRHTVAIPPLVRRAVRAQCTCITTPRRTLGTCINKFRKFLCCTLHLASVRNTLTHSECEAHLRRARRYQFSRPFKSRAHESFHDVPHRSTEAPYRCPLSVYQLLRAKPVLKSRLDGTDQVSNATRSTLKISIKAALFFTFLALPPSAPAHLQPPLTPPPTSHAPLRLYPPPSFPNTHQHTHTTLCNAIVHSFHLYHRHRRHQAALERRRRFQREQRWPRCRSLVVAVVEQGHCSSSCHHC